MFPEMYYCSGFQDRWWLLFHHLIVFVWVLKEDPEFDFNGMLSGIMGV
jgi:hypothetical protein